jgi:hypothetical protein
MVEKNLYGKDRKALIRLVAVLAHLDDLPANVFRHTRPPVPGAHMERSGGNADSALLEVIDTCCEPGNAIQAQCVPLGQRLA